MRRALALLLVLVHGACTAAAPPAPNTPVPSAAPGSGGPSSPVATATAAPDHAVVDWLRRAAVPLPVDGPDGDLTTIRALVGDARLVAIGEAAHGGREFFTLRARIFRYLVSELGFTVLAIEDGWPEADAVNDWVMGGPGTSFEAINRLLSWPGRTQEMIDVITWMREQNRMRGAKPALRLAGYDMQSPLRAQQNVVSYLERVDPDAATRTRERYGCYRDRAEYELKASESRAACRAALTAVRDELRAARAVYERATSREDFHRADWSAEIVLQAEHRVTSPLAERAAVRDAYMAQNAVRLLDEAGGGGVMLWGHDLHLGSVSPLSSKTMGAHLRERLGTRVRLVGTSFFSGSFLAREMLPAGRVSGIEARSMRSMIPGSYGSDLHAVGIPSLLLDLRDAPAGAPAEWVRGPRKFTTVGAVYNPALPPDEEQDLSLGGTFDALIHIDAITPTTLRMDR